MADTIQIREAIAADIEMVLDIERRAFGEEDVASLVEALLGDPSAEPRISLLAFDSGQPVGHVLFTHAVLVDGVAKEPVSLLAPLAVVPESQSRGIGQALIAAGIERARALGYALSIVLGHPGYYPKAAFEPAFPHGITAPHPINPPEAFMVREIRKGALGKIRGALVVADAIKAEEHWRE